MNSKHPLQAALATLLLATLSPLLLIAQTTITDDFTDPTKWGTAYRSPGTDIFVANGRMNYTSTTSITGGAGIARNTPTLPTTQDWSLKIDAHLDPFPLTMLSQFSDVFLGFGKTGDWFNTSVLFEFGRGYWGNPTHNGYYIQDNVRTNGVDIPWDDKLFENWNINSSDISLRMDYSTAAHAVTYYCDADGAANGYNWAAQGTANLASGTFNLNLSPADTFTIILFGSSGYQTVGPGQAYFDNLEITIAPAPIVSTGTATPISTTSAILTGTVNPNGLATTLQFEYGLTTAYGSTLSVVFAPSNGSAPQPVSAIINGLQPGMTYHFRLTAMNNAGSGNGSDATFVAGAIPYTFTTNNGTITITGYTGSGGDVDILSMINYLPVSTIGDRAFFGNASLTSVTIPSSVTSIRPLAFQSCSNLTSVTLPNSATDIGDSAFALCALSSITIPGTVTSIGEGAFAYCPVTSVTIPNNVTNLGAGTFYGCTSLTNVLIGSGVTSIREDTFYFCSSLTTITIPDTVTSIGDNVFFWSGLISVQIGNSVTNIGDRAFELCYSLRGVCFRGNAPRLGGPSVFFANTYAVVAYLPGTTGWGATFGGLTTALWDTQVPCAYMIDGVAITVIKYIGLGGAVTIPSTIQGLPVTTIQQLAFHNSSRLTSVGIPASVTNIGINAFSSCSSLTAIVVDVLSSSYSSLDGVLFNGDQTTLVTCPPGKIGSYTVPDTVTRIDAYAFYYCSSLTSVVLPDSVARLEASAIEGGTLRGLYFQGDAPSLGSDLVASATVYYLEGTTGWGTTFGGLATALWDPQIPFNYTTNNGTITITRYTGPYGVIVIPDLISGFRVTSLGEASFQYSSDLTRITLPESITNIGSYAFADCVSLTNITIPDGVRNIPSYLFFGCSNLVGVTLPGSVTNIEAGAFQYCTKLRGIIFPDSLLAVDSMAFAGCTSLTKVTVPANFETLGNEAFMDCVALTNVFFLGNAPTHGILWDPSYPAFAGSSNVVVYYLPGTTGWDKTFEGRPTALWNPTVQTAAPNFGVINNQFGFTITGTSNIPIVVVASTNLGNPVWLPLQTMTLTNGSVYFTDPNWTNYPSRFYRLRSP